MTAWAFSLNSEKCPELQPDVPLKGIENPIQVFQVFQAYFLPPKIRAKDQKKHF